MTRELLERRLNHMRDEVLNLGSMVEQSAVDVVYALVTPNSTSRPAR